MDEHPEDPGRTTLRRPSPLPWILLAAALIAGGAWLWLRARAPEPAPPPSAAAPAAPVAAEPEPSPEAAAAGEAQLADLLPKVSSSALVQRGLAGPEVVRRIAVVVDNLAEGVSPRRELGFLAPEGAFQAVRRGDRLVASPASHARYDPFADAVGSVDVPALAAAYRAARPALLAAYRMLGYPGPAFDRALARGLRRIAGAPVPETEPALVDEGGVYTYADRRLEALPAVEKHLLRMGPRNAQRIQAKARELLAALALPER